MDTLPNFEYYHLLKLNIVLATCATHCVRWDTHTHTHSHVYMPIFASKDLPSNWVFIFLLAIIIYWVKQLIINKAGIRD